MLLACEISPGEPVLNKLQRQLRLWPLIYIPRQNTVPHLPFAPAISNDSGFPDNVLVHEPVPGVCCFFFLECSSSISIHHPPTSLPPPKSNRGHLFPKALPETPVLFRCAQLTAPQVSNTCLSLPTDCGFLKAWNPALCSVREKVRNLWCYHVYCDLPLESANVHYKVKSPGTRFARSLYQVSPFSQTDSGQLHALL